MIIKPFNTFYWLFLLAFVVLLVVATLILKDKSRKTKRLVLGLTMAAVFVYYWIYKYHISQDLEYAAMRAAAGIGTGTFSWWDELPLHLCNVNLMMIPLACLFDNRRMYSFSFFLAPLGALMALLMPGVGFEEGYSIFVPRIMGFYFTHAIIFVGGLAICTFGLFKPTYKDTIPTALSILAASFIIFIFNVVVRATGTYPYCNYFFNVDTEGNAILNIFYNIIPVPFIYQLPLVVVILIPYILLVTTIVNIPDFIQGKQTSAVAE